jgi:hypothetical protein
LPAATSRFDAVGTDRLWAKPGRNSADLAGQFQFNTPLGVIGLHGDFSTTPKRAQADAVLPPGVQKEPRPGETTFVRHLAYSDAKVKAGFERNEDGVGYIKLAALQEAGTAFCLGDEVQPVVKMQRLGMGVLIPKQSRERLERFEPGGGRPTIEVVGGDGAPTRREMTAAELKDVKDTVREGRPPTRAGASPRRRGSGTEPASSAEVRVFTRSRRPRSMHPPGPPTPTPARCPCLRADPWPAAGPRCRQANLVGDDGPRAEGEAPPGCRRPDDRGRRLGQVGRGGDG